MNILITSAGQRVSLVYAFKKELHHTFPGSFVFTTDMNPQLSAACNVSDRYFKIAPVTSENYIELLLELCITQQIRMVVPTIDTELMILALHRKKFEEQGIHVIISSSEFIATCRDKRKTNRFFQENGIKVPLHIDKSQPTFPLFVKPFDGSLSADTFVAHSAIDLKPEYISNERFLFMEYLNGLNHQEYTVDMYYDRKGIIKCLVPRKRILVRAGEINKGLTCRNELVEYLTTKLHTIEGARGCLTAQFFLNSASGNITGIEINARFGGGFPLSYQAGANYPLWLIKEYLMDQPIAYKDDWEDQLLMLRYDGEVFVHAN